MLFNNIFLDNRLEGEKIFHLSIPRIDADKPLVSASLYLLYEPNDSEMMNSQVNYKFWFCVETILFKASLWELLM